LEIAQFWAQKKLAELELFADKNKEEIKIGQTIRDCYDEF
jgi:hypothetical protein